MTSIRSASFHTKRSLRRYPPTKKARTKLENRSPSRGKNINKYRSFGNVDVGHSFSFIRRRRWHEESHLSSRARSCGRKELSVGDSIRARPTFVDVRCTSTSKPIKKSLCLAINFFARQFHCRFRRLFFGAFCSSFRSRPAV